MQRDVVGIGLSWAAGARLQSFQRRGAKRSGPRHREAVGDRTRAIRRRRPCPRSRVDDGGVFPRQPCLSYHKALKNRHFSKPHAPLRGAGWFLPSCVKAAWQPPRAVNVCQPLCRPALACSKRSHPWPDVLPCCRCL